MSSVIIAGDVSGTVTLQAPSAAGSAVVTLQSASGTMVLNNSSDQTINGLTVGKGAGAVSTNTAVGASALAANTTGNQSAAFGNLALFAQTSGGNNAGLGYGALRTISTGTDSTGVGTYALFNSTGSYNTSVGSQALYNNTTASNNTAVGYQAGYTNSTGLYGTFLGAQAGYSSTGNANTAIGYQAGQNTTGTYNTFCGIQAGQLITSGAKNTILGVYNGNQGGLDIRTANNYIVLSDGDGNPQIWHDGTATRFGTTISPTYTSRVISQNTGAGAFSYWSYSGTGAGASHIGFQTANGFCGQITTTGTATSYNTTSDYRLKENIQPMQGALAVVQQLNPVTYTWKADGSASQGFIAHELQAVVSECVVGEKDAVDADGNPVYQGIDTSFLVATLTAAIQELNAKVEAQAAEIAALKGQA